MGEGGEVSIQGRGGKDGSVGGYVRVRVVMCLFLSMVVWQPFWPYWRYIIARVSEMHVAYQTDVVRFGIFTSAEQTTFNVSNNFVIPLLLFFLTCIVE